MSHDLSADLINLLRVRSGPRKTVEPWWKIKVHSEQENLRWTSSESKTRSFLFNIFISPDSSLLRQNEAHRLMNNFVCLQDYSSVYRFHFVAIRRSNKNFWTATHMAYRKSMQQALERHYLLSIGVGIGSQDQYNALHKEMTPHYYPPSHPLSRWFHSSPLLVSLYWAIIFGSNLTIRL